MDTRIVKANLESALREALLTTRPAPVRPGAGAGAAEGQETPQQNRNGVVVNLSSVERPTAREAQRQVAEVRANLPLALVDRAASAARDTAVLGKALQSAHTGKPAPLAEALARTQERLPAGGEAQRTRIGAQAPLETAAPIARDARGLPLPLPGALEASPARGTPELGRAMQTAHTEAAAAAVAKALMQPGLRAAMDSAPALRSAAEMLIDPAAARGQPALAQPAAGAPPLNLAAAPPPADMGARMETHAPQIALMAMGAPSAGIATSSAEAAKSATASAPRAHPELITPLLVRQEPIKDSPSYLNQMILGAAFLGLVILLLM